MSEGTKKLFNVNARYAFRRDTLERWEGFNPILAAGEPSIVSDGTDGRWLKIGDGEKSWTDLPYVKFPKGDTGAKGEKGDTGAAFTYDMFTEEQLAALIGPQGPQGVQGEQGIQGEKGEKGEPGNGVDADQTYDPTSENAQSGKAVAQAINKSLGTVETKLSAYFDLSEETES